MTREELKVMIKRLERDLEWYANHPNWNNPPMMKVVENLTKTELERYRKELAELEEKENAKV